MTTEATWQSHEKHGRLTKQGDLPDTVFAFPEQRKEPLTDAGHVRDAVARFDQVIDDSDADRALAFANIQKAARYYGLNLRRPAATSSAFSPSSPDHGLLRARLAAWSVTVDTSRHEREVWGIP
jgi:hypothetical protein